MAVRRSIRQLEQSALAAVSDADLAGFQAVSRALTEAPPVTRELPAEFAEILAGIVPPGGAFRHRQHVQLAFITVRRHGTEQAADLISSWIRQLASYARAPQKYNATVTGAWTQIIGQHVAADQSVTDFGEFAERNPALLDKRLLNRHYSAAVLASPLARTGWAEPDLLAFPWHRS